MKTPEEIKKGLECCANDPYGCNEKCPYFNSLSNGVDCAAKMHADALVYIQQLEANYQQVSKALCGKENATLDEVLQAVAQVNAELEAVKRERDALFADIKQCNDCYFCKHFKESYYAERCRMCAIDYQGKDFKPRFEWRGICSENTNDDRSCLNCKHQGPEGRGICMDCNHFYSKHEPIENTEVQDENS